MVSRSTKNAPPDDETPASATEPEDQAPDEGGPTPGFIGEYLDETPRTYQWPDGPQSAERGDVCLVPAGFDDGRWGATEKNPTRLRDNHPDQAAVTAAKQTKARDELHARLAGQDAGASGKDR